MALVFTPLATYSFTGPNANPLDPTIWSPTPGIPPVNIANLQLLSNACEGTSLAEGPNDAGNSENFTPPGVSWPQNQYIQGQLSALTGTSEFGLYLHATPNVNNYYMLDAFDNGDGTVDFEILKGLPNYDVTSLFENAALPFTQSDVFRCAWFNGTIFCYQNGVLIGQADDSDYVSGVTGVFMFPVTALANARLINLEAGLVTDSSLPYSVPDSRTTPNLSRDIQDTLIYDVQTSSNSSVPGVDSRTAGAPVDSRVASIIPLNSRTPGIYGPGEN